MDVKMARRYEEPPVARSSLRGLKPVILSKLEQGQELGHKAKFVESEDGSFASFLEAAAKEYRLKNQAFAKKRKEEELIEKTNEAAGVVTKLKKRPERRQRSAKRNRGDGIEAREKELMKLLGFGSTFDALIDGFHEVDANSRIEPGSTDSETEPETISASPQESSTKTPQSTQIAPDSGSEDELQMLKNNAAFTKTQASSARAAPMSQGKRPATNSTKIRLEYSETESENEAEILGTLQEKSGLKCTQHRPSTKGAKRGPMNYFLRDYQREDVSFLYRCYREKRGGDLFDDMGLGKIIQVIAFLSAIINKTGYETADHQCRLNKLRETTLGAFQAAVKDWPTALIMCPAGLRDNWHRELLKWSYLETGVCRSKQVSKEVLKDFRRRRLDVVIAGLEHVRENIEEFTSLQFSVIIIAEAHRIRNSATNLHHKLSRLQCPELWELLHWTNPDALTKSKAWNAMIATPIEEGQAVNASELQRDAARIIAQRLVANLLLRFLLRRTKELLKNILSPTADHVVVCAMSPEQHRVNRRIWAEPEVQAIIHADDVCCGKMNELGQQLLRKECCHKRFFTRLVAKKHALPTENEDYLDDIGEDSADCPAMAMRRKLQESEGMTALQNVALVHDPLRFQHIMLDVANPLALVFRDKKDAKSKNKMDRERYWCQLSYIKQLYLNDWGKRIAQRDLGTKTEYCGKWRKGQGAKVLIFSRRVRLLDYIESFVQMEAYEHRRLDGSTLHPKRQAIVDEFNANANIYIMLISTVAGGIGLNLTAANKDHNWPQLDTRSEHASDGSSASWRMRTSPLKGKAEARLFAAHQGENPEKGELFGWSNLFDYQPDVRISTLIQEGKDIPGVEGGKILEDMLNNESIPHSMGNTVEKAWMHDLQQRTDDASDQVIGGKKIGANLSADDALILKEYFTCGKTDSTSRGALPIKRESVPREVMAPRSPGGSEENVSGSLSEELPLKRSAISSAGKVKGRAEHSASSTNVAASAAWPPMRTRS
ncbi:hypothetical protein K437DRAFT_293678 [Tilletiaria anomala UBC 951]|uniref:Helicase C-terminal domain-containing protein n=1 Tax=Tilletiaria anomala (strain ATCC 24038 / CBS 436.72 / UBC 951) TaxID=1037660 RepID=A0A066W7M4_TILAU|nr:uncharacterized protein K437DRAFT_293678 [Tilletiaria anomala UBC 951]KDN49957.1 hypothetical protein K437DRAFT_293678 [Tilletiaria anomala UBC 951]